MRRASQHDHVYSLDELNDEHLALDQRLAELHKHLSLTPEEQYEAMVIKKRKLAIKDRIILLKAQQEHQDTLAATTAEQEDASSEEIKHSPPQIWSARQRFELIMDMIRQNQPLEETAEAHGLDAKVLERWYQSFTVGALRALEPTTTTTLDHDDVMLSSVRKRLHALMIDIDARLGDPA